MVFLNGYDYRLSNKKGKKLMVVVNGKTIHFGDKAFQHYYDKTGLLPKNLNHLDDKRRANYLKRSAKQGNTDNPNSANYHARTVLW
jgi:hypothetical protein